MQRVLLLGNNDRAALAVCRSLGRSGIKVDVAHVGGRSVAGYSRFASRSLDLGIPSLDVDDYEQRLLAHLDRERYDLLIPVVDGACQICLQHRQQLERHVKLAIPPDDVFEYAHNKQKLGEKCSEIGVKYPRHTLITNYADLVDLDRSTVSFPCYVKPIHSCMILDNSLVNFRVRKVQDMAALEDFVRCHIGSVPIMVQELVSGSGTGIYLLAEEGRVLTAVQQNRLHEPAEGGGSSYRVAVKPSKLLMEQAERLISAIRWSGVAMLEFKGNAHKENWYMMEINGRFWGSLALSVSAGFDFPLWLYQLLAGEGASAIRCKSPKWGMRQRHMSKDMAWFARRLRSEKQVSAILGHWLRDFRHVLTGNEHFDVESLWDPKPGLMHWLQLFSRYWSPFWSRLRRRLRRSYLVVDYQLSKKRTMRNAVGKLHSDTAKVLFVCRGNICRSPFAERLFRRRRPHARVLSAGTLLKSKRMVPASAERVAAQGYGVNLRHHRSRILARETLAWADVVFVMDFKNLGEVLDISDGRIPAVLLGSFDGSDHIPDPYAGSEEEYSVVYRQISRSIDKMLQPV